MKGEYKTSLLNYPGSYYISCISSCPFTYKLDSGGTHCNNMPNIGLLYIVQLLNCIVIFKYEYILAVNNCETRFYLDILSVTQHYNICNLITVISRKPIEPGLLIYLYFIIPLLDGLLYECVMKCLAQVCMQFGQSIKPMSP